MWKRKIISFYTEHKWFTRAAIMSLLPLLCCFITCCIQGHSIGQVYLPSSEWNDELFYYKQVESILKYGYPLGYYGFNENHALELSFAAWSPVLALPWILWGMVFGWNLMSPIYCNIAFMMLAIFLFVWLSRLTNRQLAVLTVLFCITIHLTRYMLSGMPEVTCFGLLIIFYGLVISFLEYGQNSHKLVLMIVLSSLMTLMRPYLALFLVLALLLWIRRERDFKSKAGSLLILALVMGCYSMISHYLSAEYFDGLYETEWIAIFLRDGFLAGCKNMFGTLIYQGKDFLARALEGTRSGLPDGLYFAGFLAMLLVLVYQSIVSIYRKKWTDFILYGYLTISFLGMLAALLLMYVLFDGGRHLMTFIVAGIFLISRIESRFFKESAFIGIILLYLFTTQAKYRDDYVIPYVTPARENQISYWEGVLEEGMELTKSNTPNYENVMIWVLQDVIQEKEQMMKWQYLYAVPSGFGFSCCHGDYVANNLQVLRSRYLAAPAGGRIDSMCQAQGYHELGRTDDVVIYERY